MTQTPSPLNPDTRLDVQGATTESELASLMDMPTLMTDQEDSPISETLRTPDAQDEMHTSPVIDQLMHQSESTQAGNTATDRQDVTDSVTEDVLATDRALLHQDQGKFWHKWSLQAKATLLAAALGIVPMIGIGSLSYSVVNRAQTEQTFATEQERTVELADKINRFMFERYADITVMAALPIFTNDKVAQATTPQDKTALLDLYAKTYRIYNSIAAFDLNGTLIAQSSGKPLGNHSDRSYIQTVLKTGKPFISQPLTSTSSDLFSIYAAAPIRDKATGKMIGVIRARQPVETLTEVVDTSISTEKTYSLVDANGRVFLSSNDAQSGNNAPEVFPEIATLLKQRQIGIEVGVNPLDQRDALISYAPFTPLEGVPSLNWSAIVTVDRAQVFASQRQLLTTLGTSIGFAFLAVSALAAYLARRATQPLITAADAVNRIGQGDLDTRLSVIGADELAMLGNNINGMADQLQTFLSEQIIAADQERLLGSITDIAVMGRVDLGQSFSQIFDDVREFLGVDRLVLYHLTSQEQGQVISESVDGVWPTALGHTQPVLIPATILQSGEQGQMLTLSTAANVPLEQDYQHWHQQLSVQSALIVPLRSQGQLYGLLEAHHCRQPYDWQSREQSFLLQVTSQLGVVLDRVALLEEREAEALRSQQLKDITLRLAGATSTTKIYEAVVEETQQVLHTDRVLVCRVNSGAAPAASVVADSTQQDEASMVGQQYYLPEALEVAYRQGQVQVIPDVKDAQFDGKHQQQLQTWLVQAQLGAPILVGDELVGVLLAHQCSATRDWQQTEIDFFTQVATQVGLSQDRAHLLEKQIQAEQEQRQEREKLQRRAMELLVQVDPVSQGDLTVRATVTEDEIGTVADSYNATLKSLRQIVTQVQTAAQQVTETTSVNESSVQVLAKGAEQQTLEITTALGKVREMASSIQAVAMNAREAEQAVQSATQTVQAGDAAMDRTVDGILAIRETVGQTTKKVKRLGESSQKISKVVNLISSFADQTNLLALNAAIEAAHAGEEGRGFAVVADEVRSLARQSTEATADIEALVAEIQAETNEVVAAMESGTEQVVVGTQLVEASRQSLNNITAVSEQISLLVNEIANSAQEQSQSSKVVAQTMADIAKIADDTSTSASSVSTSFKDLLAVAESLQASVGQFKVR